MCFYKVMLLKVSVTRTASLVCLMCIHPSAKHTMVYSPVKVAHVRNPARVDVEVWGELAERAAADLRKGMQVQVQVPLGVCMRYLRHRLHADRKAVPLSGSWLSTE